MILVKPGRVGWRGVTRYDEKRVSSELVGQEVGAALKNGRKNSG